MVAPCRYPHKALLTFSSYIVEDGQFDASHHDNPDAYTHEICGRLEVSGFRYADQVQGDNVLWNAKFFTPQEVTAILPDTLECKGKIYRVYKWDREDKQAQNCILLV